MKRRDFLKLSSTGSLGLGFGFEARGRETGAPEALYARFVPREKNLPADWLASLTRRGHPLDAAIAYSKDEVDLGVVGMTVGGIACGTVYLSGDGRLWVWDIFNQHHEGVVPNTKASLPPGLGNIRGSRRPRERDGANFLLPPKAADHRNGVDAHFTLSCKGKSKRLDGRDWEQVDFTGRWPLGRVDFASADCPLKARLEAYSPFIPLGLDDSSLPVTVMEYTLENPTGEGLEFSLSGHLNNPLGQFSGVQGLRRTTVLKGGGLQGILHDLKARRGKASRADLPLFDFEDGSFEGWQVEGTAFGEAPVKSADVPAYQGELKQEGRRLVNSHASAAGDVRQRDREKGRLVSPEFTISRKRLNFLIGGGKDAQKLFIAVQVDGKQVAAATGHNTNAMRPASLDLSEFEDRKARILIVDEADGAWGNIGADAFVLSDQQSLPDNLEGLLDHGSMALVYLGGETAQSDPTDHRVTVTDRIPAGGRRTYRFALTWHLPNLNRAAKLKVHQRHYSRAFTDARAVAAYLAAEQDRLAAATRAWVETWNDSTLPQWLLDRTILTANTLQTQNCLIQPDGRFWAWEGIGCCPGTCGHVWKYAQGHARLFPLIERRLREMTDYGEAQNAAGAVSFRGPAHVMHAIDAQAGYILRTLRDHQLSDDPGYLGRVWPATRKALGYLIDFDEKDERGGLDGLLDGRQHNTLDAEWYGKVHVLCSLYLAALRAGEELAKAVEDPAFARRCREIFERGSRNIAQLFNGEFYEQIEDPRHPQAIGVGKGCYIDQVMGQFWSNQLGLGRLYHAGHQKSALRALWKYNFVPEYGRFRKGFPEGRHYAGKGDAGLLMCTWPKGGLRDDFKKHWQYAYFNECMTGFEYEAAAHMIAERDEDLVRNGLAITRAVHDRYSARRGRNPYNEIECSDHYARAGASYAVFLALCGFEFDQSKGRIAFHPVIRKDDFRAAFITSEGWGSFEQNSDGARLELRHGKLHLAQIDLPHFQNSQLSFQLNGEVTKLPLNLKAGDRLKVSVSQE